MDLFGGDELEGEVIGVYYSDKASGFGVIELELDGADGARTRKSERTRTGGTRVAGPLADLVEGQTVRVRGRWTDHPTHGRTFDAVFYEQLVPTTVAGLTSFLLSDRFELPEARIHRVLTVFGHDAGLVIEREPDRLMHEAGLTAAEASSLHTSWRKGLALADLIRLVEPVGWPMDVVRSVFATFGVEAVDLARSDPYALLDAERCRFAHADALASHLGVDPLDGSRMAAAARAAHAAARKRDGHQYLTRVQVAQTAAGMLRTDAVIGDVAVDAAVERGRLVVDEVVAHDRTVIAVYTPGGLEAERGLAHDVMRIASARPRLAQLATLFAPSPELTAGQAVAIRTALSEPVSILTGGPGTGKTRTIAELVATVAGAGFQVALAAPTGRAAKRIEELVGHPATTIHRLLEARAFGQDASVRRGGARFMFRYGRDERLPLDLLVVDEVSMCDTWLAAKLVSAVERGTHLVLVGDPDQIPSVGTGDVLRDLIGSGAVPVTVLTEVHRQAAASRIVALARALNTGVVGPLPGVDGDVFMAEEPVRTRVVPRVVEAVATKIPDYFGVATDEIQVIAPIYRGPAGVDALNLALKAALNPAADRPAVAGMHEGDRVMQTRNDPDLDVSNGDIGRVVDLAVSRRELRVAFPRGEVTFTREQAKDLVPAWAVTVHKAQGGEWPIVVFVCDSSHRSMLWRNLAYTAVTRAQQGLVIVGQQAALAAAARHDLPRDRQTLLAARLRSAALERVEVHTPAV